MLLLLLIAVIAFAVIAFVVFVERGQRRIVVNYAKRQQGRRVFAAQSTHLPLKLNMAGVIPAIFASSIILFPGTLAQWFGQSEQLGWLSDVSLALSRSTSVCNPLCCSDYLLLFLLHGVGFQPA